MLQRLILISGLAATLLYSQSSLSRSMFDDNSPFNDNSGMLNREAIETEANMKGTNVLPRTAIHELVVDSLYIVGPGDVLKITYFGNVLDEELTIVVDPEGNIVVPKMGLLKANKSLKELRADITALIKTKTKNVEIIIQLSKIKSTIIPVTGEVPHPGSFEFQSTVRLGEVLEKAFIGRDSVFGYSTNVSLRNVTVINSNGTRKEYDFDNYLINSVSQDNPYLFTGDRVMVYPKKSDIFITGAVLKPRCYAYKQQSLYDFIRFAGGFRVNADSTYISVASYTQDGFSVETKKYRYPDECNTYMMRPEDYVVVGTVPYWQDQMQVTITGRVKNPGTYLLKKGATIAELFEKAGGKLDDADIYVAYLNRTKFFNKETPETYKSGMSDYMLASANVAHINFEESLLEKDSNSKTLLENGDFVFVPRVFNFVSVVGSVCSPGLVDYKKDKGWKYFIEGAGGFDSKAYEKNTRIFKKGKGAWIMANSVESVEPGDIIVVPPQPDDYYWNRVRDAVGVAGAIISTVAILVTLTTK